MQALIEAVRGRYELARALVSAEGQAARDRADRRLRPHGGRHRRRGHLLLRAGARDRARLLLAPSRPSWGSWRGGSSTSAASTRPCARASAAGPSAPRPCPSAHPYVLLNYTSRRRDVLTLAHELGHGVHFALAARQGIFHQSTPLTLAETASVFAETIVFGRLLAEDTTPASRLALLAENLEGPIATVFRQVAMNRFEDLVHTARRERGRAVGGALRRAVVREPGRRCSATRSRSPTATARGGPTSRTSSARPATSTPTPTVSCSRCRCMSATSSAAPSFVPQYLELLAAGGSRTPRGARRDRRTSTWPTPASGTRAWISSSASSGGRGGGAGRARGVGQPPATAGPARCRPRARG